MLKRFRDIRLICRKATGAVHAQDCESHGITALYERLSRDDDNAGESNSIVHQKQMLEDYAMKHGFTNLVHFTDDGWSGATFDRPSWNRLYLIQRE